MRLVPGLIVLALLVVSALLEVGGDACVREGLRGRKWTGIVTGGVLLAGYGIVVNLVRWDFSRLLGSYVAVFAVMSVLTGRFWFGEVVSGSTWVGLGLIVVGGLVIQVGSR